MSETGRTATERESVYLRTISKRTRRASRAVESRLIGVQVAWSAALLAGAGVAVTQAFSETDNWLGDNSKWVTVLLGFAVVVAQGADRMLARTAGGAEPDDVLRRGLERERRLYDAREGAYKDLDDPFAAFVSRVEDLLAVNDAEVIAYTQRLLTRTD